MKKLPTPYGLPVVEGCRDCLPRQTSFFCGLAPETLHELQSLRQTALYPAGASLFVEGQSPRGFFVVCTGQVKISTTSKGGRRIIFRLANPGEAVGLSSLIRNSPRQASAETVVPSQVCFFPREKFSPFLLTHPDASLRIARHLSTELHKAWHQMRLFNLTPNSRAKLAQLLLERVQSQGDRTARGLRVTLNMTEEEIGEATGTARETVSRALADLKRRGVISRRGRSFLIRDLDQLRTISST